MRKLEIIIDAGPEYCEQCSYKWNRTVIREGRIEVMPGCQILGTFFELDDDNKDFIRDELCLNNDKGEV